ncbi:MAG: retroviral-like aspartic protease family protein [Vicinamibacterales bacterium]|jgi:tetratricopeptide (TPR) repeat protein|nr:retroviral-like aspartic protease family protein [Vicinamibacterales bacterium]MDP7671854.1 retroviral-like aspartic protease family protein [Vicinamibacterales bacterium]HJO38630.1 retroviral-like aspartic protease family protein [Vicinamibacterales bacterium]|tara:strand:+ start:1152 stop:2657 length:1506 start_codon:yes stop_codon:yes gene_type:complete
MRSLRHLLAVTAALVALMVVTGRSADSTYSAIQLQLADLLIAEERFPEALEAFARAKDGATPEQLFRARQGTVLSQLRLARFADARVEAELALAESPDDPEAIVMGGEALWAAGLFDEAEQAFEDGLALDPNVPRGHHGRAKALMSRNRLDEALEVAQHALSLSPRDGEFHHTVGSLYERMHRFEEAAVAFGDYVNLLPNKDQSDRAAWSRAQIRFLRSFGRRVPFDMAPDVAEKLHTVPFRLVRDKIIVRAKVNGGREVDFVVDTGAEQTVVSREIARRQNVQPVVYTLSAGVGEVGLRGLQIGRIDSLEIGSLEIENVPCLIKNPPLTGIPTREVESFSPLAAGLSVTVDYERRRLTFGRRIADAPADVELPLRQHRLVTVRGTVNDQDASFVVDTGGEVISISSQTASTLNYRPLVRRLPLRVYGSSGWDPDAFLLPGVNLMFNSIAFPNYPVVVLNLRAPSALLGFQVGGIIGHTFLSRYRVAIDLERSVVRLQDIS